MSKSGSLRLVWVALVSTSLASAGCVSAQQHREALSDLQRLRMEAWQRGVEAAALRLALDRAAAENAQLRSPAVRLETSPVMAAVASKLDEISRRQEIMEEDLKNVQTCAPASAPASASGQPQPRARKVTDLLYSRF